MKKYFLYLVAIAAAIMTVSCQRIENSSAPGAESDVTFCVSTPEIHTRAVGDGTSATDLYYGVYAVSGEQTTGYTYELQGAISKTQAPQTINLTTTVKLTLVNGKRYAIIFWAQHPNQGAAGVDWANLTMSYNPIKANQEGYDAFYHFVEPFTVQGAITNDIELKRPFAQLNIGTNDKAAAAAAGMRVSTTKVTVTDVYTQMNFTTGDVMGNTVTATFGAEGLTNIENEDFPVEGNEYLSLNYLLVDVQKDLSTVTMEYIGTDGVTYTRNFYSVPVQRNWRTNIFGSILTDEVNYNVTIEPEFLGDKNHNVENDLVSAAENGGTVVLTGDLTLDQPLVIKADVVLDLNGKTLKGGKPYTDGFSGTDISAITIDNGATLTIYGGSVEGADYGIYAKEGTLVIKDGKYSASTSAVQVSNGTVRIEGGEFSVSETDKRYVINCIDARWKDGSAKVSVTGGVFDQFDPSNNKAEGAGTNFVADGYKAIKDDNNYVVVKEEVVPVANVADFTSAVTEGNPVYLTTDITLGEMVELTGDLNIIGNGDRKISISKSSTSDRVFNLKECANDVNINLSGVSVMYEGDKAYNRCLSLYNNTGKVVINIDNCEMASSYYPINVASNNTNVVLNVKNSNLKGFCAFQTWSSNTVAEFENCTLEGVNKWEEASGSFATIVVNDGAKNCSLSFKNCEVIATAQSTAKEYHLSDFTANATTIKNEGCTFILDGNTVTTPSVLMK